MIKEINTHEDLINYVQKSIDAKLQEKKEAAMREVNAEKELIEEAIKLINDNFLYKKIKKKYGGKEQYVLATPQMFYEDYVTIPEYTWQRGLKYPDANEQWYKGIFVVNGQSYYDMRYIIDKYEKDLKRTAEKLKSQLDNIRTIQDEYNELVSNLNEIKKVISDWNERKDKEV